MALVGFSGSSENLIRLVSMLVPLTASTHRTMSRSCPVETPSCCQVYSPEGMKSPPLTTDAPLRAAVASFVQIRSAPAVGSAAVRSRWLFHSCLRVERIDPSFDGDACSVQFYPTRSARFSRTVSTMKLRRVGEDALLASLVRQLPKSRKFIGDDCAIVKFSGAKNLLVLKTDCVVEKIHFQSCHHEGGTDT